MTNTNISWSALLSDAVNQPGILSSAYSTFHQYSIGNQMMAYSQLVGRGEQLSPIATYAKWKALGRQVKKGAKAIQLCMPVTISKKDDAGAKTGEAFQMFIVKNNWFSMSQTEGADYQHEQANAEWSKALALPALGITEVAFAMMDGNCQGYATGKNIAVNPVAILPHKTRFHELAHIVLGHTAEHTMSDSEQTPKSIKEVEAESVAYICCSILGLDGLVESRGYIQNWLQGNEISDKTAQKIFGAAEKILKAGKAKAEQAE